MAWMKHVLQMSLKRYELSQPRPQGPPRQKLPTKDLIRRATRRALGTRLELRWKIKWRLEVLGALRIMGETADSRGTGVDPNLKPHFEIKTAVRIRHVR